MQKRTIAVLMILVLATIFSLASASSVETTHVDPEGQAAITINLQSGQKISGSFNVTGGSSRYWEIDFWVRDPTGATILHSGRVVRGENFTFTAGNDGAYILNFGNSFSSTRKYISLAYDVSWPPIFGFDPMVFIGVVLVIGTVLAILAFAFYRRRHTRRKATQSPPPPPAPQ